MQGVCKVTNLDAFDADVNAWFDEVEGEVAAAAVGLGNLLFEQLVKESPQFSGDFAAGWRISYSGAVDTSFSEGIVPGAPRWPEDVTSELHRGSPEAIWNAFLFKAPSDGYRLGTPIYISNSAAHDGEPYAWKIENGTISFRAGNAGADHVASKSFDWLTRRFGNIGKSEFAYLQAVKK